MSRTRFPTGRSGSAVGSRRPHADSKSFEGPRVLPGESIEGLAWTIEYLPLVAACLRGIAAIALASGDARDAATLLGAFAEFFERIGLSLSPEEKEELDAAIAQAEEALGNNAFDARMGRGRRFEPRPGGGARAQRYRDRAALKLNSLSSSTPLD